MRTDLRAVWLACALGMASAALGQAPAGLLKNDEVLVLAERAGQLAESTAIAVPDLGPASAPLREALRVARENLRMRTDSGPFVMALVGYLKSYLVLMDAMPRTRDASPEAATQMTELRTVIQKLSTHFEALVTQMEARIRSGDRDNVNRYHEANQKLAPPAAGNARVVFFGDSITDFWRLNEYFPNSDFVNRGISGQVTSEMLGRFKADVIDLKPEAVVILAGTNDLARGTTLDVIKNNLTVMAELAKLHKIRVICASVLPVSDYHKAANPQWERTRFRPPSLIRQLNDWLKTFSATPSNGCTYLDYYSAMVDKDGFLKAELADDGLHPNAAGYRVMAPLAAAAIGASAHMSVTTQTPVKKKRFPF